MYIHAGPQGLLLSPSPAVTETWNSASLWSSGHWPSSKLVDTVPTPVGPKGHRAHLDGEQMAECWWGGQGEPGVRPSHRGTS